MNLSLPRFNIHFRAMALILFSATAAFGSEYKNWVGITNLVNSSDEIILNPTTLNGKHDVLTVKWSQSLSSRKMDYAQIVGVYNVESNPEIVSIFVQHDYMDRLKKKCIPVNENRCRLKISSAFQYGETKSRSVRFLVFHDKDSSPYMYRFVGRDTFNTFVKYAKPLDKQFNNVNLFKSVWFTNYHYSAERFGGLFEGSRYLRDISSAPTKIDSLRVIKRKSPQQKITFIDQKLKWCLDQTNKIFGSSTQLSDGSYSDPSKGGYRDKCMNWSRQAWRSMSGGAKYGLQPKDFNMIEFSWERCLKQVNEDQGHPGRKAKNRRELSHKKYNCEINRKLALLAIGADPGSHYWFTDSAKDKRTIDSGAWRLN